MSRWIIAPIVLILVGVTGCTWSRAEQEYPSAKVEQVLKSRQGRFDLTTPPSRAKVGLPDGAADVNYQRRDNKSVHVIVSLPAGKALDLDAYLIGFDARSSASAAVGPPTTMDVHRRASTLDSARDHLLAAAASFGLPASEIQKWYASAKSTPGEARTPWMRANVGYLQLAVRATRLAGGEKNDTAIHYVLTWSA